MELSISDQALQLIALLLALIEIVLAVYVFLLNIQHTVNRHISVLIALAAASSFATATLIGAGNTEQAKWAAILASTAAPLILPWMLISSVALLKPAWLQGQSWRRRWFVYGFGTLPLLITLIDYQFGTGWWYTPLPETYVGGYATLSDFTQGKLSLIIQTLYLFVTPTVTFLLTLYVALFDKTASPSIRQLARWLIALQVVVVVTRFAPLAWLAEEITVLIVNLIFTLTTIYLTFHQTVAQRHFQKQRLQPRLTALIAGITIPIILAVVLFVTSRAGNLLNKSALEQLETSNQSLKAHIELWMDLNVKALQELVTLPDMVSMDPEQQKPLLEAMAQAYPHMYLVSTTNIQGINVARSDAQEPKDYHDRLWQISARNGTPVTLQLVIGRTSGQAALVVSAPIRGELGSIVGVGMFASTLSDLSDQVGTVRIGETGFAYVVDAINQAVVHPDATSTSELLDLNAHPAVFALRKGEQGHITFTDGNGRRWRAYGDTLDNGWGVIVQQREDELLNTLGQLRGISTGVIVVGSVMLLGLAWFTMRQTLQPISALTETATAIAGGDLARAAPVTSDDELGTLARAFNTMTARLRVLIGNLEQRVAERTNALEQRSAYLEASAQVGRAVASILDPDQLIQEVVEIIRQQFGLYYVGLFLQEQAGEWAVLQAGTGQAGQKMLARGHRIRIGEGMIGWSIAHAQARVTQMAETDAMRLATAELPETRSEAAIPLRSRGRVLGALTVQDTRPNAFDESAIATLEIMADQVAVALDNAHLFVQSQEALASARRAYGDASRQAWAELLQASGQLAIRSTAFGTLLERQPSPHPESDQALFQGQVVQSQSADGADGPVHVLSVPIKIEDDTIAILETHKTAQEGTWSTQEIDLMQTIADQIAQALQSAQLYQDSRQRASREQLTRQITEKIRATQNVANVVQTATTELARALGATRAFVRLDLPQDGQNESPRSDFVQDRNGEG